MIGAGHMSRLHARRVEAGARAGACRRLRDHGRGDGGASTCRASIPSAARCAWACSTTCSAAAGTRDSRAVTVERFLERYHVDRAHAQRVAAHGQGALSRRRRRGRTRPIAQRVEWAGLLHEIGFTVSHIGFHKHGAYILENADMPGFSAQEQRQLALLVWAAAAACRRWSRCLPTRDFDAQVLALRLAVLFHHARRAIDTPRITLKSGAHRPFRRVRAVAERASADVHLLARSARNGRRSAFGGGRPDGVKDPR